MAIWGVLLKVIMNKCEIYELINSYIDLKTNIIAVNIFVTLGININKGTELL